MRKWHRWISVVFALFLVWIAVTGLLSHLGEWVPGPQPSPEAIAALAPPPGFTCPEGWRCLPPRPETGGLGSLVGFFHHLHSGEEFGPVGEAISFLAGLALLFFSFSGLWMYLQMWRNRTDRGLKGGVFWK